MNLLLPLASLLGLELDDLTGRLRRKALAWGAIGACLAVAAIFLLVAANTAVSAWLGPIWGPLALAGTSLILALAIYGGVKLAGSVASRREAQRRHSAERTALVTTAAMTAMPVLLKSSLVRQIGLPVGGALAALYLLTRSGGHKDD